MRVRPASATILLITMASLALTARIGFPPHVGPQPDGSFIVSTEQRVEAGAISFDGRPTDLALRPGDSVVAVLNQRQVLLLNEHGVIEGSAISLPAGSKNKGTKSTNGAAFHGIAWSLDGSQLFASTAEGAVVHFTYADGRLIEAPTLSINPPGETENPRPGGMAITKDGNTLFVAALDRNAVEEIDIPSGTWKREYPTELLPFEVKLTADEKTLVVSNWGGHAPTDEEDRAQSGNTMIAVGPYGGASNGSLCLIERETGHARRVEVGIHPTDIVLAGSHAFVANAASDSITEVDIDRAAALRTLPIKWGTNNLFGSMPCALALHGNTLFICNGGDNALCEMDLPTGKVIGFRPAGYYPMAVAITPDATRAFVLNTKGNGSVRKTVKGLSGNAHDFQGTVSVLDLKADLARATEKVAANNRWNSDRSALMPKLAVYHGAIQHVLYIIKENRTYDEVFGDIKEGNGDPKLCDLGEKITPNQHALVRQFTLFDNAYVSGTNSADGHAWSTQAVANDYLEHFYTGYRTYPDDGDCAMSISNAGSLWDAAVKKGKSLRVYGEFCDDELAVFTPTVTSWMQVWKDRQAGTRHIQTSVGTRVASLRPYLNPHYVYWPLLQSDQQRADIFIGEYKKLSRADKVPNLMIMSIPSDHTEGRDPNYPKPQCMVADNDLAVGRVIDAVSHSPQWKDTCIFVIEDDAQSGPDHIDGHRTVYFTASPYTKRGYVDHSLLNTVSMIRSIELMLGIAPMNRFDALTPPLSGCFTDTPDLTPYSAVPNQTPIGEMNPSLQAQTPTERAWTRQSLALDWSGLDRPDPEKLNRILWHTLHKDGTAYPAR